MPNLKLYIELEIDGIPMRGFPIYRNQFVDELQEFDYDEADDGDDTTFSAIPVSEVSTVQALAIQALDQAVGIRVEGGESGNTAIRLSATGLVIILDSTLTNTNLTINNNSGEAARVVGFGGGT